jgi:uncharacterized protein
MGLVAGIFSALFGIGGGIILVPALVYFGGFSQKMAQGTTLFMLLMPVVALGAYKYYQSNNVSINTALWVGLGFFVGGYLGSKLAVSFEDVWQIGQMTIRDPLKKLFAVLMMAMAIKMLLE